MLHTLQLRAETPPSLAPGRSGAFSAGIAPPPLRIAASKKKKMPSTPKVFIVRHGETEWSLSGKHTGRTDIPLTANGEKRVLATGRAMVGPDRLIVPGKLDHIPQRRRRRIRDTAWTVPLCNNPPPLPPVAETPPGSYVSPRKRAQRTFELLNLGLPDGTLPWKPHGDNPCEGFSCAAAVQVTDDIREWDYGEYEGVTSPEIRQIRADKGLEGRWDIWHDGCPGGESPQDVTERLDRLIHNIREKFHRPVLERTHPDPAATGNVLIVAHGHILRALALRWSGRPLDAGPIFLLEAGGVGTLSYEHHSLEEPAILLGGAFVVGDE
ncbi:phosphoglycerate mutase family protein [Cordyceps militaris CM01]|uniref:Phosphoglycerate mutase family protein n=1 Tax=Cordyceps militaris (strain CM01) TaxID=983644 RepID=G3JMM4_CORMM|nr:phosphoglycerate mutase family protein [Cordyceps militaris CM01]EGX90060.1 phosphoglycerate mutase family protein [Cordyceps militaris CM01]